MYTVNNSSLMMSISSTYELGTLESDCNENKYPPRMVLEVSSDYNNAVLPSVIKLSFTGAKRDFSTEISLFCPLSKSQIYN